jgi:Icc-related predicted phosphoesterase
MKILAVSDRVDPMIHSAEVRERFPDVDLLVSCGDLPAYYLEFIVTQYNAPLVYVPGNHDPDHLRVPGGCDIDGRLVHERGVWIMGLGGSRRYKPAGRHQYTEVEMRFRAARMLPRLLINKLRRGRGMDLLVTHAPARGIHDAEDPAHLGFQTFCWLLRAFQPALMLHGHMHVHRNLESTCTDKFRSRVLNVYPFTFETFEVGR